MTPNTEIIVREGTTQICAEAFSQCKNLSSITIPESVNRIQQYAFWNCINLKHLYISATVPPNIFPNSFKVKWLDEDGQEWEEPLKINNIIVPEETINKYLQDENWATILTPQEIEGSSTDVFSVGENKKIYFSLGNLQYQPSTKTWRFANKQTEYVGIGEFSFITEISDNYDGWIDMFGFASSGYQDITPTNYIKNNIYVDSHIAGTQYDWGVHNKISNGGNKAGIWRTLTYDEWEYLLYKRPNAEKLTRLYFCNNEGLIILPDNYDIQSISNLKFKDYCSKINADIENGTVIFLPLAGYINKEELYYMNLDGNYWCSTKTSTLSFYIGDMDSDMSLSSSYSFENFAASVRLVRDAK